MTIQIDVHHAGGIWLTHHTHLTLGPRMALDHTYLAWFVHSNLSLADNNVGQSHHSRERGLPTISPARRLTDPWVPTQFASHSQQKK
jgi:hypothetical protein